MAIELFPDPGPDDAAARAALEAVTLVGGAEVPLPVGLMSAWRRAGLEEATTRDLQPYRLRGRDIPRPRQPER